MNDITTIVLDRPRHHDLIEEIRAAGARIKLIQDGDVTASISAAIRGTNDHLAIGIGGTRQAVLAAAALRCLGGELQAQLWPTTRAEIEAAREHGIEDVNRVFTTEDLAPGEVIVVATGVSNGDLLRGVRFLADSARTHSLVMCTRCNWVRFVEGIHFFARDRQKKCACSDSLSPMSTAKKSSTRCTPSRIRSSGWTSSSSGSSTTSRSTGRRSRSSTRSRRWAAPPGR